MSEAKQAVAAAQVESGDPLVAFRFGIPTLPIGHVGRPRLLDVLQGGASLPLTLVSAAAGMGKTSLVADWASRREPDVTAWVTFEQGDEHASVFWSSVFAQLHMHGVAAAGTQLAPNATDVPRLLLSEIASALSQRDESLTLVLDGWEFTTDDVADPFDFLLRHSHGKLAAVIITRSDPVLPLHRYKLNDMMTEVRTADLAFTEEEVGALVDASGLTLTEQSIDGLATRTRGWVAGLRFATMYLLSQADPDAAVRQLAGDTGNIAEYLMAEVLEMQSDADRELLLNTCIVEILRPGLIEELGGPTAPRGLAQLAHSNAFVESLADHPGWYRYHPFFRDLLRAELNYLAPAKTIALHRRAGRWLADKGMLGTAVSHAAAAFQWAEAAQYVVEDLAVGKVFQGCEQEGLASTMRALPQGVHGAAAAIVRAAVAVSRGDTAAAKLELERAQRDMDAATSTGGDVHERAQLLANALIASIVSLNDPDAEAALQTSMAAETELEGQLPERLAAHPELVAMIMAARATAMVRTGRLLAARREFADAVKVAEAPGCESTLVYCFSHLALLDAVDGELRRASDRAERALELVTSAGVDGCGLQASSLVALSWVALQQGDAATARQRITDVPAHGGLEVVLPASLLELATARLARMDGDIGRALEMTRGVRERVATSAPWVAALCVDEEVATTLSQHGAAVPDGLPSALSERDDTGAKLSAARIGVRQRIDGAADSLGPIASRSSEPLVTRVAAELLVAEAELQRGKPARARASVQRACLLAAPEGLRWPFQDAGPEVRELVARHHAASVDGALVTTADGSRATSARIIPRPRDREAPPSGDSAAPLIDALTVKELEVLNHLSELLTTEEIAATMFVSVNTVRTHVRSILRKLSVSRRHQAVRRARALDILSN